MRALAVLAHLQLGRAYATQADIRPISIWLEQPPLTIFLTVTFKYVRLSAFCTALSTKTPQRKAAEAKRTPTVLHGYHHTF